ncbi:hypothetical protein BDZ94DRAFT_1172381 [Collybia nuda]|uniref:BTB domain-containing protein n=1 Tax=Collybia nuda TaxID=64659 RepID=A0A9P5XYK0_9AGAR|nr:hypothetical protein BDZ94DRAFT_1172381 [Collybia nuda]
MNDHPSSSPLTKRKRTSEETVLAALHEESQPEKRVKTKECYTKHPVYWAVDGNILVQIGKTRFSLYRGYLAKHSEWFRSVLEVCGGVEDPGEEATLYQQGDRIIVLDETGVTVKDFEYLLGALDESIDYCYSPPPFPTVAAILRVAHTLNFPRYVAWATQYLTNMWPTSLASVSASRIPFAKTSVSLARKCGLSPILKRALYELVRQDGFGQDDDVTLSSSDYQALLRAREQLASAWIKAAACPTPQFAKCLSDTPHCAACDLNSVNSAHIELVHASGIFEVHLYDPICGLQALVDEPKLNEKFCEACVRLRKDVWAKEREKVWADLDVWLGLGTVDI